MRRGRLQGKYGAGFATVQKALASALPEPRFPQPNGGNSVSGRRLPGMRPSPRVTGCGGSAA